MKLTRISRIFASTANVARWLTWANFFHNQFAGFIVVCLGFFAHPLSLISPKKASVDCSIFKIFLSNFNLLSHLCIGLFEGATGSPPFYKPHLFASGNRASPLCIWHCLNKVLNLLLAFTRSKSLDDTLWASADSSHSGWFGILDYIVKYVCWPFWTLLIRAPSTAKDSIFSRSSSVW